MHWIQALISSRQALSEAKQRFPLAILCPLPQELVLLPITDELEAALAESEFSESDPLPSLAEDMAKGIASLAATLSTHGPVVYAATFIHGGTGHQDALVWINRKLALTLGDSEDEPGKWPDSPISCALRHIGVTTSEGQDEFDAVGLGRYRSNNEWAKAHAKA